MPRSKALKVYEKERGFVPSREVGVKDRVYGAYLDKLDPRGRDEVQQALAATGDIRFKEFLERVMTPKYKRVSLQSIAKACNISLAEFNAWWQRESVQRALATAQVGSVMITRDMVEDARTQEVMCPRCEGLGFIGAFPGLPEGTPGYREISPATDNEDAKYVRDCPNCSASTKVKKPGDQHARDKVLEMSGLVKKGAGIQIVQNFSNASHASAISELDRIVSMDIDSTSE